MPMVLLALVFAGVALYIIIDSVSKKNKEDSIYTLPPVEARVNPGPIGDSTVYVSEIAPGSIISAMVKMSQNGFINVYKDDNGKRVSVGKLAVQSSPEEVSYEISTRQLKDGDVVFIALEDSAGASLVDNNGNSVEVQKNVGALHSHYANEY